MNGRMTAAKQGHNRVVCEVHPAHLFSVRLAAIICLEVAVNLGQKVGVLVAAAVVEVALNLAQVFDLRS